MSEDGESLATPANSMVFPVGKGVTKVLQCSTDHRKRHPAKLAYGSLLNLEGPVGFIPSIQSMDILVRTPQNLRTLMESAGGVAMSTEVTMQKEHLYSGHGACFHIVVELLCEYQFPRLYLSERLLSLRPSALPLIRITFGCIFGVFPNK